ncbi:hypothetical protein QYF36_011054 [Acer negundo]|nr:hypothetical protein QYF36_011054 [Acer negundo]
MLWLSKKLVQLLLLAFGQKNYPDNIAWLHSPNGIFSVSLYRRALDNIEQLPYSIPDVIWQFHLLIRNVRYAIMVLNRLIIFSLVALRQVRSDWLAYHGGRTIGDAKVEEEMDRKLAKRAAPKKRA